MGHQCYYIEMEKKHEGLAEAILKRLTEQQRWCDYRGTVEFKEDIPFHLYYSQKENGETDFYKADDNKLFLVVEGNRYETNRVVNKLETLLAELDISMNTFPLDIFATHSFLPDFQNWLGSNPSSPVFENEYVIITN